MPTACAVGGILSPLRGWWRFCPLCEFAAVVLRALAKGARMVPSLEAIT
jgi:hypothetical protein